jgi:hypothetical protein
MSDRSGGSTPPRPPFERQTPLPCPPWCDQEPGHRFHSITPDTGCLVRDHCHSVGTYVCVSAEEEAITDAGPVWAACPPMVVVTEDLCGISPDTARKVAAELLTAADLVEVLS